MLTEEKNNETIQGRNERRNCQQKCFHLLEYVIEHAKIKTEVDQTYNTTCKYMIDFVKLLFNKRLKCISFFNIFAKLATILLHFPDPTRFNKS